jgi:hypothetical protein
MHHGPGGQGTRWLRVTVSGVWGGGG